ncbi:MAG TPA: hypothetical protein ENK57_19595 [Polyangiaceae bacterium]|nr:hypothetical protein [Polyangiaceae bacterium]
MRRVAFLIGLLPLAAACTLEPYERSSDHGPIAEGVAAPMGEPVPYATAEQLAAFERGRDVSLRRFDLRGGLGPAFNVTFCTSCHERPTVGGSAGLYRNFFLGGVQIEGGAFFPAESAGMAGGVIRLYAYDEELLPHPVMEDNVNVIAQRNPIPFFGSGLLAELDEAEILKRADPDDLDGDGISGRPNYDRGFVGRFGRKAQTVSLEGFIRGPLFNHLGVTTDPLSDAQRAALPVDSSGGATTAALRWLSDELSRTAQAAAPDGPLTDDDAAPDPELSTDDLFDLVSFAMLLAAPRVDTELDESAERGRDHFDELGCGGCHAPRLEGPRGPLPVYSDLLLHDMGPELADGLVQGDATGSEFRTQPLWGLTAVGPYLHDGRATTIETAIALHGGEAERSRDAFLALDTAGRADLLAFLATLGGREELSPGLLPADAPVPSVGELGGPYRALDDGERDAFERGRALFDREFGLEEGVGAPRFNGDSCRACHFEPVIGGAGPRGVNVIRHGIRTADGDFAVPGVGTILHRVTALQKVPVKPQSQANVFELRQTPPLFGLGLVEGIDESAILANADPDDADGDGISGRPSYTDGGRLARFGWKAQVPSLEEFVRDAITAELGMTMPYQDGLTFGALHDTDDVADPEVGIDVVSVMTTYLELLGPAPEASGLDAATVALGEAQFAAVGCDKCHLPSLPGKDGPVPLYSDLLLHETLPEGVPGIEDASANQREFRTAPLWGIRLSAPYMHDGAADTLDDAIRQHAGEAAASRDLYEALSQSERDALVVFLESL